MTKKPDKKLQLTQKKFNKKKFFNDVKELRDLLLKKDPHRLDKIYEDHKKQAHSI